MKKREEGGEDSVHQHLSGESSSSLQFHSATPGACANVRRPGAAPGRCSLTGVHFCPLTACVAFHVAAPVELAVALPHPGVLVGVVATATAHQVAAIGLLCRLVAHPALCAHAARHWILLAVVGRFLYVHQVCIHGFAVGKGLLDLKEGGALVAAGPDGLHLHSLVVLVLEDVAQLPELGQCCPAGFSGTGPRDAVAFALQLHVFLQNLWLEEQRRMHKFQGCGMDTWTLSDGFVLQWELPAHTSHTAVPGSKCSSV